MDALYKFSAFAGTIPRRVRHAEGGAHAPVRSTDRRVARSSPTRQRYFVRNHRPAGARPAIAYAGQYANPYTYGGDPVNYVDPTGLFSFDTGLLTIGWTSSQGWSVGLESGPFSYSWNQDGSTSFNAGVSGSYQYSIFNLNGSLGYSYNSYSGHTLGVDGSACVGTKEGDDYAACAGVEAGGSEYWDGYGNYLGATAYAGAFAELSSGDDEALKVSSGYEAGFLGMEGRGAYAGVSLGGGLQNEFETITADGLFSLSYSERDGFDANFAGRFDVNPMEMSYNGFVRSGEETASGHGLEANQKGNRPEFDAYFAGEMDEKDASGNVRTFSIGMHGLEGFPYAVDKYQIIDADELYARVKDDENFKQASVVHLNICYAGATKQGRNFAQEFANLSGKKVRASTHKVTFLTEKLVFAGGAFQFWNWNDWTMFSPQKVGSR